MVNVKLVWGFEFFWGKKRLTFSDFKDSNVNRNLNWGLAEYSSG